MGLRDKLSDIDPGEDHLWGHGFDRDACAGCPHRKGGTVPTCGLCGCPLFNLDKTGAPPASCPKLDDHEA